jgi:hypothetical protein
MDPYDDLTKRGFTLSVKDGKLSVSPASKLTDADRQLIKSNRDSLIQSASGTMWSRSIQPTIAGGLSRAVGGVLEGPHGMAQPSNVAKSIANYVVPPDEKQALINAAMIGGSFVAPEATLPSALARTGITAGAGALGGALEAKEKGQPMLPSILSSGASGGIQQGLGEIAAPAINWLGKYGSRALNAQDVERVGGFLSELSDWLPSPKSVENFDSEFRGGEALDRAGEKLGDMEAKLSARLGKQPVVQMSLPASVQSGQFGNVKAGVSFDEAVKRIRELNDEGRYTGNDQNLRYAAKMARQQAHDLVQELGTALNGIQPGAGDRYLAARRKYGGTALMTRLFSEPDLWSPDGRLNWEKLQELAAQSGAAGYRDELNRTFGRGKANQFLSKIYRDAPTTARDIEGKGLMGTLAQSMRAIMHPSGEVGLYGHLPMTSQISGQTVGNVPRRFPRMSAGLAALLLGPNAADQISQMTGAQTP